MHICSLCLQISAAQMMKSSANLIVRSNSSDETGCNQMAGMVMWLLSNRDSRGDSREDVRRPVQVTKQLCMALVLLALSCSPESLVGMLRSLIRPQFKGGQDGEGDSVAPPGPSATTCMLCLEYLAEEATRLMRIGSGQSSLILQLSRLSTVQGLLSE